MSEESLKDYARGFDARAAELMDGVDACEAYFSFFEKAMRLQQSFATDLEALCASRHAQTARLFNSTPAEHNPELITAWTATVEAVRTMAQAHKQCTKVMHDQVCRSVLQMRTTLEPQLKSNLSLGRKVIQECRTSYNRLKQDEKKYHRAAAQAAVESDPTKKQRLGQEQSGREIVYRDALASHEQRVRQATTVALPGLYQDLAALEWRRIRTVISASVSALNAWQTAARVLCDQEEGNVMSSAVEKLQAITENCVHVDVDVKVDALPEFQPVTKEMIEEQRPLSKSGRSDATAGGFLRSLFEKLSTPPDPSNEGAKERKTPEQAAAAHGDDGQKKSGQGQQGHEDAKNTAKEQRHQQQQPQHELKEIKQENKDEREPQQEEECKEECKEERRKQDEKEHEKQRQQREEEQQDEKEEGHTDEVSRDDNTQNGETHDDEPRQQQDSSDNTGTDAADASAGGITFNNDSPDISNPEQQEHAGHKDPDATANDAKASAVEEPQVNSDEDDDEETF